MENPMKPITDIHKDRFVRSLAGALIVVFLIVQKAFGVDLTLFIYFIGLNLFQYGITGWCPFATYFMKIGWLQNH